MVEGCIVGKGEGMIVSAAFMLVAFSMGERGRFVFRQLDPDKGIMLRYTTGQGEEINN